MTSIPRECPVCAQELRGDEIHFQRHVNDHLDEAETEKSRKVAEDLIQEDGAQNGLSLSAQKTEDGMLDPAEQMMRELERSDAALAAAMAATSCGELRNGHELPPSLRGSLSDSAEYYLPNVLERMYPCYDAIDNFFRRRTHICSKLDLFASNIAGLGWDCGYRNIQMMLSALLHDSKLASLLHAAQIYEVPSIPEIACQIESAWKKGYDAEGAANFGGSLTDKEVWIGATETYVLLQNLGIPACMHDFETPTAQDRERMFEWIFGHFEQWCGGRSCLLHGRNMFGTKKHSFVPPIFCQWQGHSITVVGAEKTKRGEIAVLVMDPSRGFYHSLVRSRRLETHLIRRHANHPQFAQPRFQLVSLSFGKPSSQGNLRSSRRNLLGKIKVGSSS